MNLQLIFLGAPGSGKGTQAKRLKDELGYEHLSTGDLLRNEIAKNTKLGQEVRKIISSGQLVDDVTAITLLKLNCDLTKKNYIFDGFPRTLNQAKMLEEEVLKNYGYRAVYFEMDFDQLVKRVEYRRVCGNCGKIFNLIFSPPKIEGVCDQCGEAKLDHREDDKEKILRKRFEIFTTTISPVNAFYQQKNVLLKINASGDQDTIFHKIKDIIS